MQKTGGSYCRIVFTAISGHQLAQNAKWNASGHFIPHHGFFISQGAKARLKIIPVDQYVYRFGAGFDFWRCLFLYQGIPQFCYIGCENKMSGGLVRAENQ